MEQKIAFVASHLGHGGLQRMIGFVAEQCLAYFDKAYFYEIYNSPVKLTFSEQIEKKNIFNSPPPNTKMPLHKKVWRIMLSIYNIRKFCKQLDVGIVCAFGLLEIFASSIAVLGLKTKVIASERGSPESTSKKAQIFAIMSYFLCDGIVFQLENARNFFPKFIQNKSIIIHNPYIPKKEIMPCPTSMRLKTITTAAAQFSLRKGIDILIRAFAIVNQRHPDYTLVIYGQGVLLDEYKVLASSLAIEDSVTFPGLVENVAEEICNSSVFVLPSRFEGIPNVLIEALAAGVPVVATDCPPGGPRLLTNNGQRGFLVKVDDYREMAYSICRILEDNNVSEQLSIDAIKVKNDFDIIKIKQQWIEYILSFIACDKSKKTLYRKYKENGDAESF